MAKVRIGLVGTGQRGRAYMRELVKAEEIEVACLCDVQRDRLEAFAAETGASGATLTTELDTLLALKQACSEMPRWSWGGGFLSARATR